MQAHEAYEISKESFVNKLEQEKAVILGLIQEHAANGEFFIRYECLPQPLFKWLQELGYTISSTYSDLPPHNPDYVISWSTQA